MIKSDPKNKRVMIKLERLDNEIFYEVEKAYFEIGRLLKTELQKGLRRGKRSGKVFRIKSRNFRSSATGEFPQRRTGNLRKSVNFKVFSYKKMWFGIKDTAPYAVYLENRNRLLVDYIVNKTESKQHNILRTRLNQAVKRA